jgi:hypothetical protein
MAPIILKGGKTSVATQMFVFPANNPHLEILHAAGRDIAEGSGPVLITLPPGTPTNQIVRVKATGLSRIIPLTVRITPENGVSVSDDSQIAAGQTTVDVQVAIPVDVVSHIHAWTR